MSLTPYYRDDWLTVLHGDAATMLRTLEPESVHCVVTSPPYWGLRDYGTATWTGGDEACPHVGGKRLSDKTTIGRSKGKDHQTLPHAPSANVMTPYRSVCGKCGAIREDGQLGLEATPEAYVASMVAVFRVHRVLRKDGTVWLNLGDSYNAYNGGAGPSSALSQTASEQRPRLETGFGLRDKALKPKDLVGIPWMVAFALRADGWYLRSEIIWAKPNPMPESVTDRPTKSHETIFLLSKSRSYYFDADAVREATIRPDDARLQTDRNGIHAGIEWTGSTRVYAADPTARNIRSVWQVATAPYPGAHFATFPSKLIEPAIKAGTSEKGVCPECGAPWVRVVAVERGERDDSTRDPDKAAARRGMAAVPEKGWEKAVTTTGWRPMCAHVSPLPPRPAVVLDCFAGSGTTGMVAQSLGRRAVLVDLSMDYLGQLMDRNRDIPLGLETA